MGFNGILMVAAAAVIIATEIAANIIYITKYLTNKGGQE